MAKNVTTFSLLSDNTGLILIASKVQIEKGLKAIAVKAETYAKNDCPVDTGRLKNSITNAVIDKSAYIGTNVEYAPYVEFMDRRNAKPRKTGKAHFLRDAASTHGDEYKKIMEAALKS